MRHHRGGRRATGRPVTGGVDRAPTATPAAVMAGVALPAWVGEQVDPADPDLWAIVDAVETMTAVGHDASTPDGLQVCIDAGRRRARLLDEAMTPERVAEQRAIALAEHARRSDLEQQAQVYYARHGQLVKVGYSINVTSRVRDLGCEDLLATEPGGPRRETERHRQFRALQAHGEWFRLEQPLIGHIAELRELYPLPVPEPPPLPLPGPRQPVDPTGRLRSTAQIAERFGVTPSTVRSWCERPWVPVVRYPGGIDPDDVARYLTAREQQKRP